MASLKFFIQSKIAPANIYIRLSIGRKKVYRRKSGYAIDPNDWSSVKSKPIPRDESLKNLSVDLNNLSYKIENRLNSATKNKIAIDGEWLQNELNIIHDLVPPVNEDFIVNHVQKVINTASRKRNAKGGFGLSQSRIKSYETFSNTIKRFQTESNNGENYTIKDVNLKFAEKFIDWLFSKKYSKNYVGKNVDNLKAVCRDARKNGMSTSDELELITGFSEKKDSDEIIILTEKEQDLIASIELKKEALINARKWLLLGCLVGQRFSDLIRITEKHIKTSKNINIIELTQKKTNKIVAIPILPKAQKIIDSGMPYPISSQKFNEYIKLICKEANLNEPTIGSKILITDEKSRNKPKTKGVYPKWQLIGSHICRRSFASNFYGKIPTPILIGITRHSTEKLFLKYIGKSSYDNAEQMMSYFERIKN